MALNDFVAFGSAIYTRLHAMATVDVYNTLAPEGTTAPYCIYQRQDATDEHKFGNDKGITADYAVKIVSNKKYIAEAQAVYGHIHTATEDAPLSATGLTFLRCRRRSTISYRDPDGFWHVGGIYRIDAWLT